jgi:hypothetical protein
MTNEEGGSLQKVEITARTTRSPISLDQLQAPKEVFELPQRPIGGSQSPGLTPLWSSSETSVVQRYFDDHMISESESHFFGQVVNSINSASPRQFEIVGGHGAGISSKRDSSRSLFLAPRENQSYNRRDVLNSLRMASPLHGWSVETDSGESDVVIIKLPGYQELSVFVFTCDGSLLIQRTNLMKVYSHLIDPRVAVVLGTLRSHLFKLMRLTPRHNLEIDFFLFTIIFKIMTSKRIWPDLLTSHRLGDVQFWTEHGAGIEGWKTDGKQAHPSLSVSATLQLVIGSLDVEMYPTISRCPISGRRIIEDGLLSQQIFDSMCTFNFTV